MSEIKDRIIIPAEHISDQYDLREYAAIHLRIPDSGIDWLDKMIAKAERQDIAAKAMQGMSANPEIGFIDISAAANEAYKMADAMLKERDKEE